MQTDSRQPCPRCAHERLRHWRELDEEQRELVRRLPASARFSIDERIARHLFCTRCWHEDTSGQLREA